MTSPTPDQPNPHKRLGLRLVAAWLVVRFVCDVTIVINTWPDFSKPKLGMATILLPLAWGLWRQRNWAVLLSGMVCVFWLGWAVAMAVAPLVPGAREMHYPWTNLVALPALVVLLNHVQPKERDADAETGQEQH